MIDRNSRFVQDQIGQRVIQETEEGPAAFGVFLVDPTTFAAYSTKGDSESPGYVISGGYAANPSATFTRPSDTTAYASGDLVANSTTAASVVAMQFTAARLAGGSFMIRKARLRKSGTGITNASFRLHLYSAAPATITNGDNGAWSTSGSADYLGALDILVDRAFTEGAVGSGVPVTGFEQTIDLASGQIIYGLLEARGAYTPASAEVFALTLEVLQN